MKIQNNIHNEFVADAACLDSTSLLAASGTRTLIPCQKCSNHQLYHEIPPMEHPLYSRLHPKVMPQATSTLRVSLYLAESVLYTCIQVYSSQLSIYQTRKSSHGTTTRNISERAALPKTQMLYTHEVVLATNRIAPKCLRSKPRWKRICVEVICESLSICAIFQCCIKVHV